jgi:dephospho-CoA kinase
LSKVVIGLTGPTGAGKSTVAAALENAGCKIIDADRVAREVVTYPECIAELKAEYGADIVDGNEINRRFLAQRAFASSKSSARLNEITHPKIMNEVIRQIDLFQQNGAIEEKAIILDAALLFESGADRLCDTTIVVTAPLELRLNRIIKRDSIPVDLAQARIGAQHDNAYYIERAKYVFDGAISMDSAPAQARKLLECILGDFDEKI